MLRDESLTADHPQKRMRREAAKLRMLIKEVDK
jgi:hypothetical protein